MSRKRRRKSSEEITLEIKESEHTGKRYWNLRDREDTDYSYSQENSEELKNMHDEISIEFNLDENRNLTEEQKQVILNTLLQEPREEPGEKPEEIEQEDENFPSKWLILLFLVALSGPALVFLMLNSGC